MWLVKWLLLGIFAVLGNGFRLTEIVETFGGNNDELLSDFADYFAKNFENEYSEYYATGIESPKLHLLTQELTALHSDKSKLLRTPVADQGLGEQFVVCTTCRATINVIARMFRAPEGEFNGTKREEAAKAIVLDVCRRVTTETDESCAAWFDLNWLIIDYIMQNTIMDSRSICGTLPISFCKVKQNEYNWTLSIDNNDPNAIVEKSEPPKRGDNDLIVLHITDIHYDPLYKPGALADCQDVLCCQQENSTVGAADKAAGYWSDYRNCDSPWHMISDAFEHIKRTHKQIDMIYHTGDIVDHMISGTSKQKNMDAITKVNNLFKKVFPDIAVYSSVGNHEPHPLNVFGPPNAPNEFSVSWLYEHLSSSWRKWLPADTENTIKTGGYYTTSPRPGFRIISLNNNDCYILNLWIFHNGSIAVPQLEWLHDTLLAAESSGEFVHILAHIPSGDGACWTVWSRQFNRIVERFRHTISGIFNGHSHFDELNVHYAAKGSAVGVSWNGGSLTSYRNKNPNYKLYRLTPKTMEVVDFETWIFNLTEANENGADKSPKWFREYVFSEEFHDDLSPAGMNKLLEQMADSPQLLRKYWRYKGTSAEPHIAKGCDNECLSKVICRLSTTVYDQKDRCKELQKRLEAGLQNEKPAEPPGGPTDPEPEKPNEPIGGGSNDKKAFKAFKLSSLIVFIYALKMLF